ncbi:MAG: vWA domain-containing protein [Ilumatobacteraceae bacterium]
METQRYRPDGGDVDIDSSMEALSGRAAGQGLDVDALRLRAWSRPTTALCLLIDSSGSMRGRSLATAALAAAAVALRAPAAHAVLSFSSNVIVIKGLHEGVSVERVVDDVLALRGKGTTDLAAALQEASAQLRGGERRERSRCSSLTAERTRRATSCRARRRSTSCSSWHRRVTTPMRSDWRTRRAPASPRWTVRARSLRR